jgi:hypothetical protein
MVDDRRRDAMALRVREACRIGTIADDLRDGAVDRAGVRRVDQRGHVGAASRDQDRDARERHRGQSKFA